MSIKSTPVPSAGSRSRPNPTEVRPGRDRTFPVDVSRSIDAKRIFLRKGFRRLLVPVWILGVIDVSAAVVYAEHVAPRWVWAWLIFLALWFVVGAVALIFETIRSTN
jgi:hypothetical protein